MVPPHDVRRCVTTKRLRFVCLNLLKLNKQSVVGEILTHANYLKYHDIILYHIISYHNIILFSIPCGFPQAFLSFKSRVKSPALSKVCAIMMMFSGLVWAYIVGFCLSNATSEDISGNTKKNHQKSRLDHQRKIMEHS